MVKLLQHMKSYRFQVWHMVLLVFIMILFLTLLSYINTNNTRNLLNKTMNLYRRDSAERLANLTTTSLELFIEQNLSRQQQDADAKSSVIQAFNIIISQQALQNNLEDICIFLDGAGGVIPVDDGELLYEIFFESREISVVIPEDRRMAVDLYQRIRGELIRNEKIHSYMEGSHTFHVLVPFLPRGEIVGAVYMKVVPDFSNIVSEITSTHTETGALFSAIILIGLLTMFYITSYTVQQRDQAQQELFGRKKLEMKQDIEHQKEAMFTRRIYHTHHKAEKVMGFIKEDLRRINTHNMDQIQNRVYKYANFISRVIYDMKSYEPPINVIRNPVFQTNLNEVIQFIVDNIFRRVFKEGDLYRFDLDFDPALPAVSINEYVIWTIIEPLIQNVIDHNPSQLVIIRVTTQYNVEQRRSMILIEDNGKGIDQIFLDKDENGIQRLFSESATTKGESENSGYGCYIAYEFCRRCGWNLTAHNSEKGGACFTISV